MNIISQIKRFLIQRGWTLQKDFPAYADIWHNPKISHRAVVCLPGKNASKVSFQVYIKDALDIIEFIYPNSKSNFIMSITINDAIEELERTMAERIKEYPGLIDLEIISKEDANKRYLAMKKALQYIQETTTLKEAS